MPKARTRARTTQDSEEDAAIPQNILELLAKSLASELASKLSDSSPSSTSPPTFSTGAPTAFRTLSTPKLGSPDTLTIPQFRDWKIRWSDFANAQQLDRHPINTQQGILRSALNEEWTMLWSSGRLHIKSTADVDEIVEVLEAYLRRKRNPLLDRKLFHQRDQMTGESVDRYFAALKTLDDACAHEEEFMCIQCNVECKMICEYCDSPYPLAKQLQEIRIRDRLICGLLDKEMQRKVLAEQYSSVLTLEKVLTICTAVENSNTVGATLASSSPPNPEVNAAKKSSYKKQQNSGGKKNSGEKQSRGKLPPDSCWFCGNDTRHPRQACPAKDSVCKTCNGKGHYTKLCFKKGNTTPPPPPPEKHKKQNNANNNIASNNTLQQLIPILTQVGNSKSILSWLPDTGSDVDAISEADFKKLGPTAASSLIPRKVEVLAANGIGLGAIGSLPATLTMNGRSHSTTIGVYKNVTSPLLSKKGCIALGFIDPDWPLSQLSASCCNEQPSTHAITSGKITVLKSKVRQAPEKLKDVKERILQDFATAFDDTILRPMNGNPMRIELMEGAVPCKKYRAHNIPFHWRDQVKEQLESMMKKGVIEPVPIGEAIDWCHPMVVVPKKGTNEPRITVDLTGLNKYVRRPAYPVKVPKEVVSRIPPGNRYFTTLDARHGYWQVPLDDASKKYTAFITPWGSYRYCRNVMGLISAGDEHNRRGDEALLGIENVEKIVEDILIYDKDLDTHIERVRSVIQRCQENGITLNSKKFKFAEKETEWCGFHITSHGYTPAPHLISALLSFPVPTSKTDIRSFCGLVQQFEAFSHKITELVAPIRSLLSSKAVFVWGSPHQRSFQDTIKELSSPRVLAHYQPNLPLRLETDAAQSKGLGYALWQKQLDQQWKLLQAGSRYVTPTESRYSASEIEMLAVVWATKKCRLFLLGNSFELIVDHRPLIPIINSKTLDEIENPRLQRFKEKLSSYQLYAIWRAGAKHTVVDVFSRFPVSDPDEEDLQMELDSDPIQLFAAALTDPQDGSKIIEDSILQMVQQYAANSSECRRLRAAIQNGFPDKHNLDEDLRPYWKVREDLSLHDDLIFYGSRLLIPKTLRSHVLKILHRSHQGQDRTLRRARQTVFWPGITNDIRNVVRTCKECAAYLPSQQKEPLLNDPPPAYPFEQVAADLFSYAGSEYLAYVDRFSGWISVAKCGASASTSTIIHHLKKWMTDLGIPTKLMSDNGPQFSSLEFKNWTKKWGISHSTSSPHYPQSNGLAESAVKAAKYLLAKSSPNGDLNNEDFQTGLMELRNTPRADGVSPSQLLFGAPLRTDLPFHRSRFCEEWRKASSKRDVDATTLREKARQRYDATAKALPHLSRGDIILIQDIPTKRWTIPAEVVDTHHRGRSYNVRTESGRLLRRNRRFLRIFQKESGESKQQQQPEEPLPVQPRRSSRKRNPPQRYNNQLICWDQGSQLPGGHEVSPHILEGCSRPITRGHVAAWTAERKVG